ncbi:serine/threonine-protein kinase [Shewanella sp. AS16]|uniref:serine/threonine-protein kinase n=1 Tax=Shewanella sp. AS16 TaxID=2907625 RepID=UPI001F198782|nr:serine/threonine-protein kinase [Shewanella sp. AS16]MCE9684924.1 serine/threonine-protein kinase [Shewanella sp. AS16]
MSDLKRVKELFDACLDLPPQEQSLYVEQSNCTEAERSEVMRLLDHLSASKTVHIAGHAQRVIGQHMRELSLQFQPGQLLGQYRILEEIGVGGMGVVLLAERADGQYQQKVAIKLAPSFSGPDDHQHFAAERQLLANLQHPHIAMLLDGGLTDDKRPYLVMEYVEGENLQDYCVANSLSLAQRLELFLNVCDAVGYAHNRLIIHCDLKPENLLVNQDGVVKLLDFGTSRLLQQGQEEQGAARMLAMTLSCASPEQVLGEPTTTATDVYGLGALLYQLLTGKSANAVDRNNMAATLDAICRDMPLPPGNHDKRIAKDLDNIALKALQKLPEDRYPSVSELAWDIKRFLKGQTVSATPTTAGYRFAKLLKRHPVASSLASALAVAMTTGLVATNQLNRSLTEQRDTLITTQASLLQQTHTAGKVIELLTDMFDAASPANAQGEAISIDKLVNSAVTKTRNTLSQQPDVKSRLLGVLSRVQNSLGQDQQAVALMEEAFKLKQQDGRQPTLVDVAELGSTYTSAGQFDEALSYLRQGEQMAQAPGASEKDRALVNYDLGLYFEKQSQFAQAQDYYLKADAYWQQHPDEQDTTPLEIRFHIAYMHYYAQEYTQAIDVLTALLIDTERLFGANHPQNLNTLRMLSNTYRHLGDYDKAEAAIVRAYQLAHRILDPNAQLNQTVTQSYAYLLTDQGRYQEEIDILNQELAGDLTNQTTIGNYHSDRGQAHLELGNFQASKDDFEQALALLSPHYADSTLETFPARLFLAYSRSFLGEAAIGDQALDELYAQAEQQFQKGDYNLGLVALLQGAVALNNHDLAKADRKLQSAKAIFDAHFPPEHVAHVTLLRIEGDYYLATQQWQQAHRVLGRAWQLAEKYHPPGSVEGQLIRLKDAQALWHQGDTRKAREITAEAAPLLQQKLKPDSQYYRIAEQTRRLVDMQRG